MNAVSTVNASGLSCPQPVILTRQALRDHPHGEIVVLVDSATSRDNVRRLAEREGCSVVIEEAPSGGFRLLLSR